MTEPTPVVATYSRQSGDTFETWAVTAPYGLDAVNALSELLKRHGIVPAGGVIPEAHFDLKVKHDA